MPDTNPDDDTMKHQQALDLDKPEGDVTPPPVDGAMSGRIQRLEKSLDADGFLHSVDEDERPADDDESAEDLGQTSREINRP